MTDRIKRLHEQITSREYRKQRKHIENLSYSDIFSVSKRAQNLKKFTENEEPILFPDDMLGFSRSTDVKLPQGDGNVTPNYGRIITVGFDKISEEIKESMSKADSEEKLLCGKIMLECIEAVLEFCERYRRYAREKCCMKLFDALGRIPRRGAETFYEALVFMKISIFFLRASMTDLLTLGRFDQYMYPFYLNDRKNGISDEEIFEMLEEFFISLNRDSDLYNGVQMGDNGQSMVLGGFDKDGNDTYNELSKMCIEASLELKLIDPKINLRVGKNTPIERLEFATRLTKAGLGFPQYCNDDVVVSGLVKLGYDYEDAVNYCVAACWEFIIPGKGADVPNIDVMNFPYIVGRTIKNGLEECQSFDELMNMVKNDISSECDRIIKCKLNSNQIPNPFASIYFDGCIEALTDLFYGGTKYHNFGCHGTGISVAADSLAAVKRTIYDEKLLSKSELITVLESNFEGYTEIRNILRDCPKMGNNDDYVDSIAAEITEAFSSSLNGRDNGRGGIWRAGTGSAQAYIFSSKGCPATSDGRLAFSPYPSSYSPSLDAKTNGLLSVIASFTKFDLSRIINGGPLTIEIHDSVLRNEIGIKKTAMLVKEFIDRGGHQLQLNSTNRERLIDAQKHPEKYPNLIVRVWGWSGYFSELDLDFQNQIIRRCEYSF